MARTAQDAYKEHIDSIRDALFDLRQWAKGFKDDADWGDVGDVTEVDTQLKTVLEFVKSIPQG